jgi:mannose-6-phosphate isomerase-like protein (cupin superfamily)
VPAERTLDFATASKPIVALMRAYLQQALTNQNFRRVLFTARDRSLQVVAMTLQPGEDIGSERHPATQQYFAPVNRRALVQLGERLYTLEPGSALAVNAGELHDVCNPSATEPLHLLSAYEPAQHPARTLHRTKLDALAAEAALRAQEADDV